MIHILNQEKQKKVKWQAEQAGADTLFLNLHKVHQPKNTKTNTDTNANRKTNTNTNTKQEQHGHTNTNTKKIQGPIHFSSSKVAQGASHLPKCIPHRLARSESEGGCICNFDDQAEIVDDHMHTSTICTHMHTSKTITQQD